MKLLPSARFRYQGLILLLSSVSGCAASPADVLPCMQPTTLGLAARHETVLTDLRYRLQQGKHSSLSKPAPGRPHLGSRPENEAWSDEATGWHEIALGQADRPGSAAPLRSSAARAASWHARALGTLCTPGQQNHSLRDQACFRRLTCPGSPASVDSFFFWLRARATPPLHGIFSCAGSASSSMTQPGSPHPGDAPSPVA